MPVSRGAGRSPRPRSAGAWSGSPGIREGESQLPRRATQAATGEGEPAAPPSNPPPSRRSSREHRTAIAHARVTPREFAEWQAKADTAGVTLSQLIRAAMERTRVWSPDSLAEIRALIREVGRIGANVNQIARWANTHKDAADAAEVLVRLAQIERDLSAVLRLPLPRRGE